MKKFAYEARDRATDKIVKSTIQADSESGAAKALLAQGFIPLDVKDDTSDQGFFSKLNNHITTKDKIVFTRQLATLIGAGLPLSQGLATVLNQTENKKMQEVIADIAGQIEGGKSMHQAFSRYPEVFDPVYLSLIAAGEVSGTLDDAMNRIANQQEKDAAIASKIKGALTYPVIVLVVIIAVVVFMLIEVVPQVQKLYESLGKNLPLLTQIMVDMANFVVHFWWVVLIVIVVGGYFFRQWLKTENGIHAMDVFKLNVPLFKGMFHRMYMGRFTRTAQTLLGTGVSMLDTLKICAVAVNNSVVAASITRAADKVQGGKALSTALEAESEIITPLVPQMIKIGEQSGKIDEMLGKVAQIYEDELDAQIATISTAIEPILMVVLAVVAGGMVGAILFPIYGLTSSLSI